MQRVLLNLSFLYTISSIHCLFTGSKLKKAGRSTNHVITCGEQGHGRLSTYSQQGTRVAARFWWAMSLRMKKIRVLISAFWRYKACLSCVQLHIWFSSLVKSGPCSLVGTWRLFGEVFQKFTAYRTWTSTSVPRVFKTWLNTSDLVVGQGPCLYAF